MAILTDEELAQAQEIINHTPPGVYELSTLYGNQWQHIEEEMRPVFGSRFKKTVEGGHLEGIKVDRLQTDNHRTYEITNNRIRGNSNK